jgi:ATP synthase protein I
MQQADAAQAKRYLTIQAILGAATVIIALPFGGPVALSALIGAGACLIANALFAASVFRGYRAQEPERLLLRIYAAEVMKVALILGIFALSFASIDGLNLPVLLGSYLVTQVVAAIAAAQSEVRRASGKPVPPTTAPRSER